jgi:serine/threonine protein kinase
VTTPSHIGQYRIIRKIGAGGMGLVFLGEHTLLGRRAAIKTLLPTVAANKEIVERFFNEARATSAISDPGVIQVFDFGYHVDGTAYIVMEMLEGEALSTRIERLGRLALADALRIARQIAGSLAVAHGHHIVHRDLKPENIFLIRDAEAQNGERTKILDFGICKVASDDVDVTQAGVMVGTPVYMSPEQCRGGDGVDHRSDIYAFGCLLFHMITGRPPFIGDATGDLIVAHLEEAPPAASVFVPGLPFGVDGLLLQCLAKAPGDRFQSMTELQTAISDLYAQIDTAEVTIEPVTPAMPLGRGFRSIYNGNVASRAGGSFAGNAASLHARMPWLHMSPPPASSTDELDVVPPRRSSLRAIMACVLVAGVAVGLLSTSYVIYSSDRREEAEERAKEPKVVATEPAVATALVVSPLPVVPPKPIASDPPRAAKQPAPAPVAKLAEPQEAAPVVTGNQLSAKPGDDPAAIQAGAAAAIARAALSAPVADSPPDVTSSAAPFERATRRSPEKPRSKPVTRPDTAPERRTDTKPVTRPDTSRAAMATETRVDAKPSAAASDRQPELAVPPPRAADPEPPARPVSPPTEDLYDTR